MKRNLFALIAVICMAFTVQAQNYSQILTGYTWKITSLEMNEDIFIESESSCVYSTEINFINSNTLSLNRPCIGVTQQSYNIVGNLLIIDNSDTLNITSISTNSFITELDQVVTDADGNESIINIVTSYEKK